MTQAFHLKYRPRSLEKLIGHEDVVTRLQGMVKSGKVPNAIMFSGPSSAGKTTLARCLAAAINGVSKIEEVGSDYLEHNGTDKKTIEDIRRLIEYSKYKPKLKKRVIVIDEGQGIISNPQAAAALLKPLEEPSKDTVWIICTMDPSKFTSGNGKAIANRCTQFVLKPHTPEDLTKQAKRIIKREGMDYAKGLIETLVQNCNGEMRTLANLLQAVQQYADGLDKTPTKLKPDQVSSVISSVITDDEKTAVKVMLAVYKNEFHEVQRALLDVDDAFRFVTLLLNGNQHLLNMTVLKGEKHPRMQWWSNVNRELAGKAKGIGLKLEHLAAANEALVELKFMASSFQVDAIDLLSAKLYRLTKTLAAIK